MLVRKSNNAYFPSIFDVMLNNGVIENNQRGFSRPCFNVIENSNEFIIEVAAPGFEKNNFYVEIKENILEISSKKEVKAEESKEQNYHYVGFSYGSFKKEYSLPDNIDKENVSANYENGILKVVIPKSSESKITRQISVK